MYSQDAISSRKRRRPEPTEETYYGLACTVCGADFRSSPRAAAVVAHHNDRQLLACEGVCARMACGSATGLDETPPPLEERLARQRADRS